MGIGSEKVVAMLVCAKAATRQTFSERASIAKGKVLVDINPPRTSASG
jgi:hypothetical protein